MDSSSSLLDLLHERAAVPSQTGSPSLGDASALVLALTSSDSKKAFTSAALARSGLEKISVGFQKQVEDLWEAANAEALSHLTIVMQNNPMKSKDVILARPDVKSALSWPYEQAAIASEKLLRDAWAAGEVESVKKTKGEFKLLKEDWKGHEIDEGLLDALVGDLHANAKAMRKRYRAAVKSDSPEASLKTLTNDSRTRASFSVSTAVWGVATQVRESAARLAGLNKMWVSRMDSATCSHCKDLHGTVVGPFDAFPKSALKTYLNAKLMGPPRHPRCRCIVVLTKLKKTKSKT